MRPDINRNNTSRATPRENRLLKRFRFLLLALCLYPLHVHAGQNVLADPGFERYRFDAGQGYYVPAPDAAWEEFSFGAGSVTWDASHWTAPEEMVAERALGFTPGAYGFEGLGTQQNSGALILQQDIVDPTYFQRGRFYEAWVWLGGAGNDDDTNQDRKEEVGGWDIFFYGSGNPATWTDGNALEHHTAVLNYPGQRGSFVRVSGYGRFPSATAGIRMRVRANTWAIAAEGNYNTRVALDNAHFALLDSPNLLANGDFEQDQVIAAFNGWQHPATYDFPLEGFTPIDLDNVYEDNFDHGGYRPYFGYSRAYGYATYLNGWIRDSFSFSQTVNWNEPPGTPAVFMCYWVQNTDNPAKHYFMRDIGSSLEYVVRYLDGTDELARESDHLDWPTAANGGNTNRYDQNANAAYNPRLRLLPPTGTNRIELNINVPIDMVYADGRPHVSFVVDDFYLGAGTVPPVETTTPSLLVR